MRIIRFPMTAARARRVLIVAVLGVSPLSGRAATWTGGGTTDNFMDAGNWGGVPLVATDPLVFDGFMRLTPNNDFGAGTTFSGMSFAPTAGAFTVGGNSISLAGSVVNLSAEMQTINTALLLAAPDTLFNATAGGLTFGSAISGVTGTQSLTLGGIFGTTSFTNTISSIVGNGSAAAVHLNVTGGLWALTGANTFSGNVNVTGGTFRADSGTGLPTNALLTLNGGVWETGANVTRSLGSGPGNVRLIGNAAGFSANGAPITVALGAADTTLAWGSADFNPGTLTLQASSSSAPLTFAHGLDLAGGLRTISVSGSNAATITGAISDSVGGATLQKVGSSSSVLVLNNGTSSVMTNHLMLTQGQVRLDLQHNLTITGNISGAGSLLIPNTTLPGATITLSGNNTFSGSLTLQAGTFVLNSDTNTGDGTGLFRIENRVATNTQTALLVVGGPRTINNPVTYLGASANNPGLQINGTDSLTFAGPVTGAAANQWYNSNLPKGKTVNFNGPIYLSNSASNRNMRFAGDGDYLVNGPIYNAEGDNQLLSNSQISKFGTGAVIINSTTLSYTGGTSITLGTVVFNRAGYLPPAVNNTGGPVYIAVNTNGAVGYAGGIQDPDFLSRLSNASIAGNSTGSLAIVSAADAATNVDFNAAADNWGGMGLGAANGAYTYSGVLTPRGQGWRLGGGNGTLTFAQALEDRNGQLTNLTVLGGSRGVLILTNAGNTYTGSTEVRANGTLKNGVDNAIATNGNTTTVNGTYDLNGFNQSIRSLAGSGTLTSSQPNSILTIVPPGASTFGGSIVGSLGIVLNGNGTVTLTGTAAQTGPTAVNGGLLQYNNTTGSTFSVGTLSGAGTAQVAANNTVISDGVTVNTLQVEGTHTIRADGGATGASRIPELAVAINAGTWTGKLDLTNNVLVVPAANGGAKAAIISTLRDLVDSGRNGGTWDGTGITSSTVAANPAVTTLALVDNADLQLTTYRGLTGLDANSVLLVQARFGDATIDGTVDAFDLNIVAGHWQQASGAMWSSGDFNGDGMVDAFDLNILASNWQFGAGGSLAAALGAFPQMGGAVPEPASLALLLVGGVGLLGRRRRR